MKSSIRLILLVLGMIMLLKEAFLGIPALGGIYIFSVGWAPLFTNIMLYIVIAVILVAGRYNHRNELMYIPVLGAILNIIAFIPFIGMVCHWIMALFMLYFVIRVLSYPAYSSHRADPRSIYNRRY
ncbi:hypothetical protein ERX35_006285 [Macrococcus equipercicus]|uniref:Uncharacterized protein n=1 Tax=Macrococcus equipercicus TaxID=69967 RepID=A0ABQ6R952_9STAP|nr:hypothetical protein [Macrococcus equipercicus]KAA1039679.1 hypothetical protein ERX35_006285 [Macrococcus equipercicus]